MSDPKNPADESREDSLPERENDRTLLGEYPAQVKENRLPLDIAGEGWAGDIDYYPERSPKEDARWAIRTVWIWIGFDIFCILFIFTLLILGAIYD